MRVMPRVTGTIGALIRRKRKEGSRNGFVPRGDTIGGGTTIEPKAARQVDSRKEMQG